jgi:hypothetical protein
MVTHGDVAYGAGNGKVHGQPLLEELAQFFLLQGAGVHSRSQRRRLTLLKSLLEKVHIIPRNKG